MAEIWYARFNGFVFIGEFEDLIDKDNEIIAIDYKRTFYSTNAEKKLVFRADKDKFYIQLSKHNTFKLSIIV
jgi:hypothetical protein